MQFYDLNEYLEPGTDEQGTDGWDESNSHDQNDWKVRRPCKYFVNYGSCRKGIDCKFSHEKDDSYSWHNTEDSEPQSQDDSAASGSKDAEENTRDWSAENQNDKSLSDGDGNTESNKATDNWWNDNGAQGGTDQWDINKSTDSEWNDNGAQGGTDQWDINKSTDNGRDDGGQGGTDQRDKTKWGSGNDQRDSSGWDATAEGNSETSRRGQRQDGSRPGDSRRTICKYYVRGSCHRPDCRFAHETDDTALHDWNKDEWVTRNPLPSKDGWGGKEERGNRWGNESNDRATRPDQSVCFANLRGACYRATCRFSHESAGNQLVDDNGNSNDRANTWDSSQNRTADAWDPQSSGSNTDSWHQTDYISPYASSGRPREACLYFGQGYCQKGDSCPLLHVQSDEILSENQEVSVSIFHRG